MAGARRPLDVATRLHARAEALRSRVDLGGAAALARESLALFERHAGRGHPDVASVLNTLGAIQIDQGRFAAAEKSHARAARIIARFGEAARAEEPELSIIEVHALRQLGNALRLRGRYVEADAVFRRALAIAETEIGRRAPETASVLNDHAVLDKYRAHYASAARRYRRALAILEARGAGNSLAAATIHHNLGGLAHAQRRFAHGEPHARRAVVLRRRALGPTHPTVIADEVAWAALLEGLGQIRRAERIYRKAIGTFGTVFGTEHSELMVVYNNLAAIVAARGDTVEAHSLYTRTLTIKRNILGRNHPDVAITLNNLGMLYAAEGKPEQARTHLARALEILTRSVGKQHKLYAQCQANLRSQIDTLTRGGIHEVQHSKESQTSSPPRTPHQDTYPRRR